MEQCITVDGARLEIQRYGTATGDPTLVLLHEGLGCAAMWRQFPKRLCEATRLPVVAYSRAGYGGSDPAELPRPADYMHREAVDVLPGVLDGLGIEQAVLVGHSDGGSIALLHAGSQHGRRIRGLVLLAAHVFNEALCISSIEAARRAYEHDPRLRERLARYHGAQVDATFYGWNDVWLSEEFRHWNIESCLPRVRCPALVVQGRDDQYGTLAQVDAIESGLTVPTRRLILDQCRHSAHLERPDATLAAIAEFVRELPQVSRSEPVTPAPRAASDAQR